MTTRLTCRYGDCNEAATGSDQLQIDAGRMLTVNYCERHKRAWEALPDIVNNGAGRCVMKGCDRAVHAVFCCQKHYAVTRPWKMATALRFSATMPEVPMTPAPAEMPAVQPPPTSEVSHVVAPPPPAEPKESDGEGAPPDFLDEVIAASGPEFPAKVEESQRRRSALNQVMPDPVPAANDLDWRALRVKWQVRVKIGLVYDINNFKFMAESLKNGRMMPSDTAHAINADGATVAPWMPIESPEALAHRMLALYADLTATRAEPAPPDSTAAEVQAEPAPTTPPLWPPETMDIARRWCAATGDERDRLARQLRAKCGADMEVVAIRATVQAEQLQRELAAVTAERDTTRDALTRIASQLASVGLWAEVEKSPAPEVDGVGLLTTRYLVERESAAAETARADLLDDEVTRQRERADAAERDAAAERVQANEALSQLHDAKEAMKAGDEGYRMVERENREAVHILRLLGVKVGTLPDMITALLPKSRLLKLRIRNETAAALAVDNLSLQEVPEDDPRMVEAIRLHREATALRRAAEPDHAPDAGKVQG